MPYYLLLVLLSAVCYAVQFAINKLYQSKKGSAVKTSLKFIALKGTVAAVVFFFVAWIMYGRPLTLHPMSVLLACIASLLGCACWILGFVIFKYGSMSIFSTFLMIGGMTVPFIYSAFRGESLGAFKIIGIILLIGSLVFPLINGKGEKKSAGSRIVFVILCALVFLCNGGMSVFSSIHSGTDFVWFTEGTVAKAFPEVSTQRVEGVEFTVLVNIANAVFCSVALGVVSLIEAHKLQKGADNGGVIESTPAASDKKKFTNGKAYLFLLIIACALLDAIAFILMRVVDESGQIALAKYPMQTAFTVVLSAVAGFVAFREKPSRLALIGLIITFISTFLFIF